MRLTDRVRTELGPLDPAPPPARELPAQARYRLEDLLVQNPVMVSARTGVGPTPSRRGRCGRCGRWLGRGGPATALAGVLCAGALLVALFTCSGFAGAG